MQLKVPFVEEMLQTSKSAALQRLVIDVSWFNVSWGRDRPHGRSSMTNDNQDKNQGNEDAQLVELVYHIKLPGQRKAVVH